MTKKTTVLIFMIFMIFLVVIAATFGFTDARYEIKITSPYAIDFLRTVGDMSIPNPDWTYGYKDSFGGFSINAASNTVTGLNLHFNSQVANGDKTYLNEAAYEYYVRVVVDGFEELPVSYTLYGATAEWNQIEDTKFNCDAETGYYGPFQVAAKTAIHTPYRLQFVWTGDLTAGGDYTLKVQTVKRRAVAEGGDGSWQVLGEAPVLVRIGMKVPVTVGYYGYRMYDPKDPQKPLQLQAEETVSVEYGTQLNFNDSAAMEALGFHPPKKEDTDKYYDFVYVAGASEGVDPEGDGVVEVTDTLTDRIEAYYTEPGKIPVTFIYRNFVSTVFEENLEIADTSQTLFLDRGTLLDFRNLPADSEIEIPAGYTFVTSSSYSITNNSDYHETLTVPTSAKKEEVSVNVFVTPGGAKTITKVVVQKVDGTTRLIDLPSSAYIYTDVKGNFTVTNATIQAIGSDISGYGSYAVYVAHVDATTPLTPDKTCVLHGSIGFGSAGNVPQEASSISLCYYKMYGTTGYCLALPDVYLYVKAWW